MNTEYISVTVWKIKILEILKKKKILLPIQKEQD